MVLVSILVWSIVNFTGYLIMNQFIKSGYFGGVLVKKLSLNEDLEYKISGSARLHWNPFSLGINVNDFVFFNVSEENRKLDINFKSAELKFNLINLINGRFLPKEIYLKDNLIHLDVSAFKNDPSDDYEHDVRYKSVLGVVNQIKSISLKNTKFDFITWGGERIDLDIDYVNAKKDHEWIDLGLNYKNKSFKEIDINGRIKIPKDMEDRRVEVVIDESKVISNEYKFLYFNRIKSAILAFSGSGWVEMNKNLTVKESQINFKNVNGGFDREMFDEHGKVIEIRKEVLKNSSFLFKWNEKSKFLSLVKFIFFLDDAMISGDLNADLFKSTKTLSANFESKNLNLNQIDSFWPSNLASYTRSWFERSIRGGNADVDGKLIFLFDNKHFLYDKSSVEVNAHIENGEVICCGRHMPIIKGANGKLKITMDGLSGDVKKAYFDDSPERTNIIDSKVFVDFNKKRAFVEGKAFGKLKNLINFYKRDYKIEIFGDDVLKNLSGDGEVKAKFDVDLSDKDEDLSKLIEVTSKNVTSRMEVNKAHISSNDFLLIVDDERAKFSLDGLLNKKKFGLKGDINLMNDESEYDVRLNDNNYKDFSRIFDPIIGDVVGVTGNISGNIKIVRNSSNDTDFGVNLDLTNTKLLAPYIKLNKDVGEDASLFLCVNQKGDDFYIRDLNFDNENHKFKIDYLFYDEDKRSFLIKDLNYNGQTHVNEVNISDDGKVKKVDVKAKDVYYENFNWLGFSRRKDDKAPIDQKIIIGGKTDNLIFKNESRFKGVEFNLSCDTGDCQEILIHNSDDDKKNQFNASMINDRILIVASNAGAFLSGLDITEYIHGGQLYLEGYLNKYPDGSSMIQSSSDLTNFTVKGAPAIAKLLSLTAFDSIVSILKGEGISFDNMRVNLIFIDDKVFFSRSVAEGNSLGISFEGEVNIVEKTMKIHGSLAPLNIINIAIRQIPLFGSLLVGNKGDGLFTIDFKVEGDIAKPNASVNPITIFAPYAIKRFFTKSKDLKDSDIDLNNKVINPVKK